MAEKKVTRNRKTDINTQKKYKRNQGTIICRRCNKEKEAIEFPDEDLHEKKCLICQDCLDKRGETAAMKVRLNDREKIKRIASYYHVPMYDVISEMVDLFDIFDPDYN